MAITPQMVKELREKTGAGMGDCKKALDEANGDMTTAIEILRKKGAASASKRAEKAAKEGIVIVRTSNEAKNAIIVEVNCETDFVARNEEFVNYATVIGDALEANNPATIDELLDCKAGNDTVRGIHNEILAKFSENIGIKRFEKLSTEGSFTSYIHMGSKLGVLLEVSLANPSDEATALLKDITMQIAAMRPSFVYRSEVSEATLAKEKEIYVEIAIQEGKKPEIAERVATGKIDKFFQENCLFEQAFVKDGSKTVGDVVKEISKIADQEVKLISFRRYFLGE
jgi:elongation factor Ts